MSAAQTDEIFTSLTAEEKHLIIMRYDELDFVDEIQWDLKCRKCNKLAIHHVVTECKHLLCKTCLNQLRKSSHSKCPACEKPLQISAQGSNLEIENRISKLKVYCCNIKNGCLEMHPLRQLQKHLYKCQFNRWNENNRGGVQRMVRGNSPSLKTMEQISQQLNQLQLLLQTQIDQQNLFNQSTNQRLKDMENKMEAGFKQLNEHLSHLYQQHLQQTDSLVNGEHQVPWQHTTTSKTEVNILLVGERSSGKSTLINSFAHCLRYRSFEEAETSSNKEEKIVLIPAQFSLMDEDYNERKLSVGSEDSNEKFQEEEEANGARTRACKSYLFSLNVHLNIRFIDSRGLTSFSEEEEDVSVNDIVTRISQYEHIHAIAVVLKPETARQNSNLERCFKKIFSAIHSSAASNFLFIFTHCTKPGNNFQVLKTSLSRIANGIGMDRSNVFCLENETFKHLMAYKQEMTLDGDDLESSRSNWAKNVVTFQRLLDYVTKLRPHPTFNTSFVQVQRTLAHDVTLILQSLKEELPGKSSAETERMAREKETLEEALRKIRLFIQDNIVFSGKGEEKKEETEVSNELVTENDIKILQKKLLLLEIYGEKLMGVRQIEKKVGNCLKHDSEIVVVAYENNTFESTQLNAFIH